MFENYQERKEWNDAHPEFKIYRDENGELTHENPYVNNPESDYGFDEKDD